MKIYLFDDTGQGKSMESGAVPRIGDRVQWFYEPAPYVQDVVWFVDDGKVKYDAVVKLGGKL